MTMDVQTYREGRKEATEAAEAIRAALAGLGLPESTWGSVRPRGGWRKLCGLPPPPHNSLAALPGYQRVMRQSGSGIASLNPIF